MAATMLPSMLRRLSALVTEPEQIPADAGRFRVGGVDLADYDLIDTHAHRLDRVTLSTSNDKWNGTFVDALLPRQHFPGRAEMESRVLHDVEQHVLTMPRPGPSPRRARRRLPPDDLCEQLRGGGPGTRPLPQEVAAPLPGGDRVPRGSGRGSLHLPALPAFAMEGVAHDPCAGADQ